jgi:hypothetical protein
MQVTNRSLSARLVKDSLDVLISKTVARQTRHKRNRNRKTLPWVILCEKCFLSLKKANSQGE